MRGRWRGSGAGHGPGVQASTSREASPAATVGAMNPGPRVVVMGVSGSGKSTVGALTAARLGVPFRDADDLHPSANVEKMSHGIPLTDDDRAPWLDAVGAELAAAPAGLVMACSALRRAYRDRIRLAAPDTVFAYLDGSPALLAERIGARRDHFMPPALLTSQLATLEVPGEDEGVSVAITADPDHIADEIAAKLGDWISRRDSR